jgi:hypothetical protein
VFTASPRDFHFAFEIQQLVIIAFAYIKLNDETFVFGHSAWAKVSILLDHLSGDWYLNEHCL